MDATSLYNDAPITEARRAIDDVAARQEQHAADMQSADAALQAAVAARQSLLTQAAAGAAVTAQQSRAAELTVRDAEGRLLFLRDLSASLAAAFQQAQEAFEDAHREAARPMAEAAAAGYVAAAARLDAAHAAVADAKGAIDDAAGTLRIAHARGFRINAQFGPRQGPVGFTAEYSVMYPSAVQAAEQMRLGGVNVPEGAVS